MAYVVAEPCIKCKYTDCVEVCPVNCFYEGANFLVIHPDECIDCALCVPECPVDAIFTEEDLPADQKDYAHNENRGGVPWSISLGEGQRKLAREVFKEMGID